MVTTCYTSRASTHQVSRSWSELNSAIVNKSWRTYRTKWSLANVQKLGYWLHNRLALHANYPDLLAPLRIRSWRKWTCSLTAVLTVDRAMAITIRILKLEDAIRTGTRHFTQVDYTLQQIWHRPKVTSYPNEAIRASTHGIKCWTPSLQCSLTIASTGTSNVQPWRSSSNTHQSS